MRSLDPELEDGVGLLPLRLRAPTWRAHALTRDERARVAGVVQREHGGAGGLDHGAHELPVVADDGGIVVLVTAPHGRERVGHDQAHAVGELNQVVLDT